MEKQNKHKYKKINIKTLKVGDIIKLISPKNKGDNWKITDIKGNQVKIISLNRNKKALTTTEIIKKRWKYVDK